MRTAGHSKIMICPYQQPLPVRFFNSSADFLNKYRSASQIQKTIIENMVSDKSINGEEIDANILKALSKETGRDFMNIDPILEELRSMKEG